MTNDYASRREAARERAATRLKTMRPIDQLALFDALRDSLPSASFRELKIVAVHDDHETYPALKCPWCKTHLYEGDVIVVEVGTRETASGDTSPESGVTFDYYDEDEDQVLNTRALHLKCRHCDAPVTVPSHVQVISG